MMKRNRRLWSREELVLTLNLYHKTPFGRMHKGNPDVIKLSKLVDRTPSAVAYKLVNFASLDLTLKKRGIKGAQNSSHLDRKVWEEFQNDREKLFFESEETRAKFEGTSVETFIEKDEYGSREGVEKMVTVKQRVNQSFFRKMILASYNNTCCITGINIKQVLVAGHIIPWSEDRDNRLNPRNGIAINALHDKAFERGLISITPNFKIKVANELLSSKNEEIDKYFIQYHEREMVLPSKFLPDERFLNYHYTEKFRG